MTKKPLPSGGVDRPRRPRRWLAPSALLMVLASLVACSDASKGPAGVVQVIYPDLNPAPVDLTVPARDLAETRDGGCGLRTCASEGARCGLIGDGCGGVVSCGACPPPQTCGGGGVPYRCGPVSPCAPRTCAQAGASCGVVADGCGGVISCGDCSPPNLCGGGGVPYQCGYTPPSQGPCTNLCKQQVRCDGGTTTITGTVFAPTNPALGYGSPDPLFGASVYIPNAPVRPFTPGVSCDQCDAVAAGEPLVFTQSGTNGTFTLSDAPCGNDIPLVIQLGRWRRQIRIPSVACCQSTALSAEQTRLPRKQSEGDIPLIAVVSGICDPMECLLTKLGIDESERSLPSGTGRVRFYNSNGLGLGAGTPRQDVLYGDPAELAKYDVVISDCECSEIPKPTQWLRNLVDYTVKGGRFVTSDFGYAWLYTNSSFTPTATWAAPGKHPTGGQAVVDTSFARGRAFAEWLTKVGAAPLPILGTFGNLSIVDPMFAQRWLTDALGYPIQFSFDVPVSANPAQQCGRVMFSDFHVVTSCKAAPLTRGEKTMEFLLFDATACLKPLGPPSLPCKPLTCEQQGLQCGLAGDGCGGTLLCGACPLGQVCGSGGIATCGPVCLPRTCAQQGLSCGPAGDGCGGALACGSCPAGQVCGGGGPGRCGMASCAPRTCAQQGAGCGPAGDGCGGALDCGACPVGLSCGGSGEPFLCGGNTCPPLGNCSVVGSECGLIGDGCGGVLSCGSCAGGRRCGGGGKPNICG